MSELWTLSEIASAVNGVIERPDAGAAAHISSLSIDTRTLEPGALYIALQGVRQDGHQFVPAAFEAGAGAALVGQEYQPAAGDGALIRVSDTMRALEDLGRAARARALNAKIIAVTGSAGKTGTKEALLAMLSRSGATHASVKSFNNHWGVPLTLARMSAATEFGVFEVGMNHAGEITPLSQMIRPEVALITTVAPVHIGHFANEEEIADAKGEIFAGLGAGGVAVLPRDNRHYERLKGHAEKAGAARILSFGEHMAADARLVEGSFGPEGSHAVADILGEQVRFETAIPGQHIVINLIGALLVVKLVGADLQAALAAIHELEPPEGRGTRSLLSLKEGAALLIDESYNANPASMRVALLNLSRYRGETHLRRIAVLGDMLELGELSQGYHEEIAALLNDLDVEKVFAAGPMMKHMFEKLIVSKQGGYQPSSDGLLELVEKNLQGGDVVMVKGSLGSQMGQVVQHLQDQF